MTYENLLIELDDAVATITLNRPDRLNALSEGLQQDYENALGELDQNPDIRVIRLRGAGRAFCSGYDLQGDYTAPEPTKADGESGPSIEDGGAPPLRSIPQAPLMRDREALRRRIERWLRIWNYRKPIIAQVHGYAVSGGLDLLGATDLAFATATAKFGHPAARANGIPITLGMLPMKIGFARTKQLLFTGDLIAAPQAESWGLIQGVFDEEHLDEQVLAYCHRIALNNVDSLTLHKHVTNRWAEVMGIRLGALEGAEFDSIFHSLPALQAFANAGIAGKGLKAALDWRDNEHKAHPSPLATE